MIKEYNFNHPSPSSPQLSLSLASHLFHHQIATPQTQKSNEASPSSSDRVVKERGRENDIEKEREAEAVVVDESDG